MRRGTEDIAAADLRLAEVAPGSCAACTAYADDFEQTGHLLRAVAITASPALVAHAGAGAGAGVASAGAAVAHGADRDFVLPGRAVVGDVGMAVVEVRRLGGRALRIAPAIVQPGIMLFLLLPAVVIAVLMLAFPRPCWKND